MREFWSGVAVIRIFGDVAMPSATAEAILLVRL